MPVMLTHEEIVATVQRLAAERVDADPTTVNSDTEFHRDLNYDSLDDVEFTMELEEAFELTISDEQAQSVKSVGRAIELVEAALRTTGRQ